MNISPATVWPTAVAWLMGAIVTLLLIHRYEKQIDQNAGLAVIVALMWPAWVVLSAGIVVIGLIAFVVTTLLEMIEE